MWNIYHSITPVSSQHIQILPSGATEHVTHWICTYYDGFAIHVYDSANNDKVNNLTPDQLHFVHLLFPDKPNIVYEDVQQQTNAVDCGVFAIAFAVSIANNMNPSNQAFHIASMRSHLKTIFETKILSPFPIIASNETPLFVRKGGPNKVTRGRPVSSIQIENEAKKNIKKSMETDSKGNTRLKYMKEYNAKVKDLESEEQRHARLKYKRLNSATARDLESEEQRDTRLKYMRVNIAQVRDLESDEQRYTRLATVREKTTFCFAMED